MSNLLPYFTPNHSSKGNADGLPNLLNDFFERRIQVIKSGVHCFVFGFTFPDYSADVQSTDFNLPPPPASRSTSPKFDKFIFG
jgi:hypothetical protein